MVAPALTPSLALKSDCMIISVYQLSSHCLWMFIQTKMQILCPGWIPDIQCIGCQLLQDLSNKMYRNDHLSENELLDTSKLFKSQAALGRWRYLKARYQRTLPLMSRNQCLARLIGRLVSRLHQIDLFPFWKSQENTPILLVPGRHHLLCTVSFMARRHRLYL